MARRIIKRRQTQKRRRTRQRGAGCDGVSDCSTCRDKEGNISQELTNRCNENKKRSRTRSGAAFGGNKSRRRIKRKGTKRRKS